MTGKCILAVYAHPDDETSGMGGSIIRYVREGAKVYVACATRGEWGTLGTGRVAIKRADLSNVRENELRAVLQSYGAEEPIFLDYVDQEVDQVEFEELVSKVIGVMHRVSPDIVVTFGPLGISRHQDHMAIHRATLEAFKRYVHSTNSSTRLLYDAVPKQAIDLFDLDLDGPETQPNVFIDITNFKHLKIKALRSYRSQEDAQWLADSFEDLPLADVETFHQVYPPLPDGVQLSDFWA